MAHADQLHLRHRHGRIIMATLICLASASTPLPGAEPLTDTGGDVLWTDRPVKVDRGKQTFERLPSLVVIDTHKAGLDVPQFFKMIDSATFAFANQAYRIRNILPIRSGRICKASDGHRWACGRMSMVFLGRMIRGRRLYCDTPTPEGNLLLIDCKIGNRNIAEEIIARGFGHATGNETLIEIERKAIAAKAGIWENEACAENFRGC